MPSGYFVSRYIVKRNSAAVPSRPAVHSVDYAGVVAQDVALTRPALVRRLVLAGTGPQGAPGLHGWRQDIGDRARADNPGGEGLLLD
jgi:pimeloyl-ACP methyl ester carboxylesterase